MARRQAIEEPSSGHLIREAEAITGGVLALFLVLAFVSYYPDSPRSNLGGALGHNLEGGALQALGFSAYLLPAFAARKLEPVVGATFPFTRIAEAHQLMEKDENFGKIVLTWAEG